MGWSIGGLSAINRTGKVKYFDGISDRVNMNDEDCYILDGQRLVIYHRGTVGNPEFLFRTEIESYSEIFGRGNLENGPEYFEVIMPDRTVVYYGKTTDSRAFMNNQTIASSFLISEMIDPHSNYIKYNYDKFGNETYIKSIEYTGNYNKSMLSYNKVEFYYSERNDQSTQYFKGSENTSKLILREIRCLAFDEVYRRYKLTYYEKDNTSFLYSVEESVNDDMYNPIYFNYGHCEINYSLKKHNLPSLTSEFESSKIKNKITHFGDFNNDGITDILFSFYYQQNNKDDNPIYICIYLGKDDGTYENNCWFQNLIYAANEYYNLIIDDFDQDGLTDFLISYYDSDNENNAADMVCISLKIFFKRGTGNIFNNTINYETNWRSITDLSVGKLYDQAYNGIAYIATSLSVYNPRLGYLSIKSTTELSNGQFEYLPIDKDFKINTRHSFGFAHPNLFVGNQDSTDIYKYSYKIGSIRFPNNNHKQFYGDFNGDGLLDVLTWRKDNYGWLLGLNTDSIQSYNWWNNTFSDNLPMRHKNYDPTDRLSYYKVAVLDLNADGFDDIVEVKGCPLVGATTTINGVEHAVIQSATFYLYLHYSTGTEFYTDSIPITGCMLNDMFFSNVQYKDIIPMYSQSNPFPQLLLPIGLMNLSEPVVVPYYLLQYYLAVLSINYPLCLSLNLDANHRLLTCIKDGIGNVTNIEYSSCLDKTIYSKNNINNSINNDNAYLKTIPLRIVSNVNSDNNTIKYSYYQLLISKNNGKGLLGFSSIVKHNPKSKTTNFTYNKLFSREYLLTVREDTSIDNNGASKLKYEYTLQNGTINREYRFNTIITQDTVTMVDYLSKTCTIQESVFNNLKLPATVTTKVYSDVEASELLHTTTKNITYSSIGDSYAVHQDKVTTTVEKEGELPITNIQFITYNEFGRIDSENYQYSDNPTSMDIATAYTYNEYGTLISSTSSGNGLSRCSLEVYDNINKNRWRFPTSQINSLGYVSYYTYDYKTGNVLTSFDVNELMTRYYYDDFRQLIQTVSPSGITTDMECGWSAKLIDGDIPIKPTNALFYKYQRTLGCPAQYEFYDKYGNLLRTATNEPELLIDNKWLYIDKEYDDLNRIVKEYLPSRTINHNKFTEYKYISNDSFTFNIYTGRIDSIISPDGSSIKYLYNGKETTRHYYVDNSLHSTIKETVDALGNLEKIEETGGEIYYGYYSDGNVKNVLNNAGGLQSITSFEYDVAGNRTVISDPDAGIIKTAYSVFGEVIRQQSAEQASTKNGKLATYIRTYYDNGGRITSQKTVTGNFTNNTGSESNLISYLYCENKPTKGMLISETSLDGKKEYSYDQYLRLKQVKETVVGDGKSFTFGYEYDSFGRLFKEIYPHASGESDASTLSYTYDSYGYPVMKHLGSILIWEARGYADQGQLSSYILGNNIVVTKTFDDKGRLTNITSAKGNTKYQNMSYGFRPDGNMHFRADDLISLKEWFNYDTQNRLIGWEISNLEPSEYSKRISYTGNRIDYKESTGTYTYSNSSDYPHHSVFQTRGQGTIGKLETQYDHNRIDGRARVSLLEFGGNAITYTHGTADEVIKKVEIKNGSTYTTYYTTGGKYELRIDTSGNETKLSYLGSGIVKYDAPGTSDDKTLYLLKDHLGSIIRVLSINGSTVNSLERFSYDVWGNRRNATDWTTVGSFTPTYIFKGFTGHEHIEGFGLIHMRGRVYDPRLGLFLSPDPYIQSMTTQGFNRYSYCLGNPLSYTDPNGEFVFSAFLPGIGTLIDAACWGAVLGATSYMTQLAFTYDGMNNWNWSQFGKAVGFGAASGFVTAGIGSVFGPIGSFGVAGEVGRAITHGISNGMMSAFQGGDFLSGFASGSISSLVGSAIGFTPLHKSKITSLTISGLSGGIGAKMAGGDFWQGVTTALIVSGLNHMMHGVTVGEKEKISGKIWNEGEPTCIIRDGKMYVVSKNDNKYYNILGNKLEREFLFEWKKSPEGSRIAGTMTPTADRRWVEGFLAFIVEGIKPPLVLSLIDSSIPFSERLNPLTTMYNIETYINGVEQKVISSRVKYYTEFDIIYPPRSTGD
jgi:RHS repeat-associated protein